MKATKETLHYAIPDPQTTLTGLADILMSYHSMLHDSFTDRDIANLRGRWKKELVRLNPDLPRVDLVPTGARIVLPPDRDRLARPIDDRHRLTKAGKAP